MKQRSQKQKTRFRLIRNLAVACIAFLLIWILGGMPAFTKNGAFRRAMQENLIREVRPQFTIASDWDMVVMGEKDSTMYQVQVWRQGIFWYHNAEVAETRASEGLYIVPLLGYGDIEDAGDIAVLAEGTDARCSIFLKGSDCAYPLTLLENQDGWFCFAWRGTDETSPMWGLIHYGNCRRIDVKTPGTKDYHGLILFESYDMNGIVVQQGAREF